MKIPRPASWCTGATRSATPHYLIFHNEWVDEYYTLYPDGAGVRAVDLWAGAAAEHEVLDTIMVKPPGTRTGQLFAGPVATLANLDGREVSVAEFGKEAGQLPRLPE
ncbi:MAG: hypothetical protein WDM96_05005 [Lacunisphaera sp.]